MGLVEGEMEMRKALARIIANKGGTYSVRYRGRVMASCAKVDYSTASNCVSLLNKGR